MRQLWLTAVLLVISFPSNLMAQQQVCLSNGSLPTHCRSGDIIVVRPKEVATSCDFTQQIVKLRPGKDSVEFLCRYTGKILSIKPNTSLPPRPLQPQYPIKPKKKSRKWFW